MISEWIGSVVGQHFFSLLALIIIIGLCLSLVIYQFLTGVPSMSANSAEIADVIALLKQATLPEEAIIYDLGCGWGALVIALAQAFPYARIRGIELSPFPYWIARFRTRHLPNIILKRGNFYNCDVRDANAITCYLMMSAMPRLASFLDHNLVPGTAVVALTFWFHTRQASAIRNGPGLRGEAALYCWPAHKSSSITV